MSELDLVCDTCLAGPFGTIKGFKAHLRSHDTVECPDCGKTVSAPGLGPHRRSHGVKGTATTKREQRERDRQLALAAGRLSGPLRLMLPGAGDELVERLARFVARHEPRPGIWAVITADDGPWLCSQSGVGMVGARAKAPIVAVPIALVYEHLNRRATAGNGSGDFHAGASWPHPRSGR